MANILETANTLYETRKRFNEQIKLAEVAIDGIQHTKLKDGHDVYISSLGVVGQYGVSFYANYNDESVYMHYDFSTAQFYIDKVTFSLSVPAFMSLIDGIATRVMEVLRTIE